MHAALAFLLVLTIHRCYPAGVPRFLQGDLIRRQIRSYTQTLAILWAFAILINLPLFAITKYETIPGNETILTENNTNITRSTSELSCFTGATEIWSRTYLILLLVFTYLITGIFLIVIYGQVIRIILASKKYAKNPIPNNDHYRYLSRNNIQEEQYRSKLTVRRNQRGNGENFAAHSSSTSSTGGSTRRQQQQQQQQQQNSSSMPLIICKPIIQNDLNKSSTTNSHSTQHLQVIVMLFIVILLYILLLLPYRLLNLLFIVHNQLFQQTFMNEILFRWLLNSVRLLVFLNCALQPIIYLIISSRLRQTVIKLLRSWFTCFCRCQCSSSSSSSSSLQTERHYKSDTRAIRAYLTQKYQNTNRYQNQQKQDVHRGSRPFQTSLNNIHLIGYQGSPLTLLTRAPSPIGGSQLNINNKNRYAVSFTNGPRK
jgi:hypothetical protein